MSKKDIERLKNIKKQNNMKEQMTRQEKIQSIENLEKKLADIFNQRSEEELRSIIERHKRNKSVIYFNNHDKAFQFLRDNDYSVDILGTVSEVSKIRNINGVRTMCLENIYMVAVENDNVCICVDHIWMNEELSWTILKNILKYPGKAGYEVFINRLKPIKYTAEYCKNGVEKHRYQLTQLTKKKRIAWVQKVQRANGITMSAEKIAEIL